MKKLILFIAIICQVASSQASTSITTASVSGHWTLSGSPYLIYNDVTVLYDSTLTIDPGVEVIFQGYFSLTTVGTLKASGTPAQYINFHVNDTTGWYNASTTNGGWKGMNFNAYIGPGSDSSIFQYCNIHDMKTNGVLLYYRILPVKYCNFYHNSSAGLAINANPTDSAEVGYCSFYNNVGGYGNLLELYGGNFNIHNNEMYQNIFNDIVYAALANLNITSNSFHNNRQPDTSNGAVLEIWNSIASISKNMVYENTTLDDGAISEWYSQVDINMNYICNNKVMIGYTGSSACGATQGGGGIRLDNEGDTLYHLNLIRNNIIANNYTAFEGAAVYVFGSNVNIFNNQIVNNYTDDFGSAAINVFDNTTVGGTHVCMKNNLFYHNITSSPSGNDTFDFALFCADTLEFDHNYIHSTYSATNFIYSTAVYTLIGDTTTNVINTAQQMINPTVTPLVTESAINADFRLVPTAVCINTGDTTKCNPGAYDYWQNVRIYGTAIDIGACEFNPAEYATTGISNTATASLVNVSPNPMKDVFYITNAATGTTIRMFSLLGREVYNGIITNDRQAISISNLLSGIYLLQLTDITGSKTETTIVKE